MNFDLSFPLHAVQFMAVMTRVSGFFFAFPLFRGESSTPKKVKVHFLLAVSICMLSSLPEQWATNQFQDQIDTLEMSLIVVNELLLGLTISVLIFLFMEAVAVGAEMISSNIGYSASSQFDPSSGSTSSTVAVLLNWFFLMIFLTFNFHYHFLESLSASFYHIPPGSFSPNSALPNDMIRIGSRMFTIGFQMSLPFIAIIMLTNIAMGIISRFGEEFQVLMLSFPLRLGLGLIIFIAIIPLLSRMFRSLWAQVFDNLHQILGF